MSTPLKTTSNMTKHLTRAELSARTKAEQTLERPRAQIRAPKWLGPVAREIFTVTKRRLKGLKLLDTVDADMLAMYSDAIAQYRKAIENPLTMAQPQIAQSWSRVALSYAEKLGISPSARARLARQKAQAAPQDDMEDLLNDVQDFVNGNGQ